MVLDAIAALQPVTVAVHRGESQIGINRRGLDPDGVMGMRPNAEGLSIRTCG